MKRVLAAALLVPAWLLALAQDYPVGVGPRPALPAPARTLLPTVHVAKAVPWTKGQGPIAAAGLAVSAYASGLAHPRWLYVLPNGDVLVAEANKPSTDTSSTGIKGVIMKHQMKKAGAAAPSANRITLLRGLRPDGSALTRTSFLEGLYSPFGMVLVGNELYIANADALLRFPYQQGQTVITSKGTKLLDLPSGINHHWTKNVVASADGKRLYVAVGSNSNVGENGMEKEDGRAAIWEYTRATGKARVFATGLRNPVGLAIEPQSGVLWTTVNERDELGNDLVPDYLTSVADGAFYGWPYSYFGQNIDPRVEPQNPDLVARAVVPDYALGAHTASLGLAFYTATLIPAFKNGALVGRHGSWNRKPYAGYKLIFIPFDQGKPAGPPQDVLTGFLGPEGQAYGRPVGVAVDKAGAILLADDVGNTIWRVRPVTP